MGVKRVLNKRICCNCGSDTTYQDKYGYHCWSRTPNGWMCNRCYCRIVIAPKWHKINNPKRFAFGSKALTFLGSKRMLTGRCSRCPKNIFNGSCKRTQMHHWYYLRIAPMTCREELCPSCHIRLNPSAFYEKGHLYHSRKIRQSLL
jgi:hypothetical protein